MLKDRNGQRIFLGSCVIWHDPEKSARDLSRVWDVYDFNDEIVFISDKFGEAEVFPNELEVVN